MPSLQNLLQDLKNLQENILQQNIEAIELSTPNILQNYIKFKQELFFFPNKIGNKLIFSKQIEEKFLELDLKILGLIDRISNVIKNIKQISKITPKTPSMNKLIEIQYQLLKEQNIDLLINLINSNILDIIEFIEEYEQIQ